jgi:hypothetical protein
MIKKYPNDSVKEFYDCTEEIAAVLDKYFGRQHGPVNDMSDINTFVEEYVNGWGISARSYGTDDVSRETQQSKQEDLEEPYSKAINSMFDLDSDGKVVNADVVSVTLPDGGDEVQGALEDVTRYEAKSLKIQSNGKGGLEPVRIRGHEGDEFQLVYDSPYFGNDKTYASRAFKSINLEQVLECMNEAMKVTQDYHHCFVENLCYRETYCQGSENQFPGCHILEIITGS